MRNMKDSGIEWIGEIPVGWEIIPNKRIMRKVKNVCEKYNGEDVLSLTMNGVIKRDLDNPSGKMPLSFDGYQYIKAGNLLMCLFDIDVTPRCIGVVENDGVTSPAYSQFELNKNAHLKYYYYYYLNLDYSKQLLHLAKNLRHSLTESQLGEILTPIPPYKEQHRISTYLDTKCEKIDSIIARQQEVIEKLKTYKLSVITEAVTKGLNPDVRMKDSGVEWIGDVPEHWEITKFKYLSLEIGDGIHTTPEYDLAGSIYFINGNNIGFDNLVFKDNTDTINEDEYKKYKPSLLTTDTILITLNGATYGKTSFYNSEKVLLGKSAGYITLKPTENKRFLRYYLQSNAAKLIMEISLLGSTIANLSLNTLKNFSMSYPPKNEQCEIVEYLDKKCSAIDSAIAKKQAIIEKLTAYKKSLIYEVVTGKREV
ncbi:MAG: restriction endonuclease subunit S [Ruminococcus sp.]|nr:restriction endonuclease subunit S [Ruminococcus sp.]